MNIDETQVRGVIRQSLHESHQEGCSDELCTRRAIFHALKAMTFLCKDQPFEMPVKASGAMSEDALRMACLFYQPTFANMVRVVPQMVAEEKAKL